jgi:TPP-dependent pyruvate/acetoin dehydrogenase alpha subunit
MGSENLESGIDYHYRALCVRRIQSVVHEAVSSGKVRIPVHFAFGHELLAVKAHDRLSRDFFLPHRNIHYNISLCFDERWKLNKSRLVEFLSELKGGTTSPYNGYLGSMNYIHPRSRLYTSSILSNHLGIALGAALSKKWKDSGRVTAVIGDGALEEGRFWESLIVASSKNLPIDILVEDNSWSMQSSIDQRRSPIDLRRVTEGVGFLYYEGIDSIQCSSSERPRLVYCSVKTLGGALVTMDDASTREVNYHCGPILGSLRPSAKTIDCFGDELETLQKNFDAERLQFIEDISTICEQHLGIETDING